MKSVQQTASRLTTRGRQLHHVQWKPLEGRQLVRRDHNQGKPGRQRQLYDPAPTGDALRVQAAFRFVDE